MRIIQLLTFILERKSAADLSEISYCSNDYTKIPDKNSPGPLQHKDNSGHQCAAFRNTLIYYCPPEDQHIDHDSVFSLTGNFYKLQAKRSPITREVDHC